LGPLEEGEEVPGANVLLLLLLELPLASTVLLLWPSCRASWPMVLLLSALLLEEVEVEVEEVVVVVVVPAGAEEVPGRAVAFAAAGKGEVRPAG
jgi:hypothetical protein